MALSGSFFVTVGLAACCLSDFAAGVGSASVRTAFALAPVANFEARAFSLLRVATISPVAVVELVEGWVRGLTMTLLSDEAAGTLVSDETAGAARLVFG